MTKKTYQTILALLAGLAAGGGSGYVLSPAEDRRIDEEEIAALDDGFAYLEGQIAETQSGKLIATASSFRQLFTAAILLEKAPPTPVDPPPPVTEYGCPPDAVLVDWVKKLVAGGGRPPSVPDWESGATVELFDFRGDPPGTYTQNGVTGGSKSWKDEIVVRDAVVRDWNKWGWRGYGVRRDVVWQRVTIRDGWQEHGIYVNLSGLGPDWPGNPLDEVCMRVSACLFENIPSQAIQTVQAGRQAEYAQPALDFTPGGWVIVEDTLLRNVGDAVGGSRPSFALSFFKSMNPVRVSRVVLDNSMHARSRGALMAHGRDLLVIEDSSFATGVLEQPMWQVWDVGEVVVSGCSFEAKGGQNWLDFQRCGIVRLVDCDGLTRVRIDGTDLGPVEGMTLP